MYHSETGNTEKMAGYIHQGCVGVEGIEARCMSVDDVDEDYIRKSSAIIFGAPTYYATCSWQMKAYLDREQDGFAGKLAGTFSSQNWPGGGGASFAQMTMIAALLVHGMIIYSGGIKDGWPYLHFGAVSTKEPIDIDEKRCLKLGDNIARKAMALFGNR